MSKLPVIFDKELCTLLSKVGFEGEAMLNKEDRFIEIGYDEAIEIAKKRG